METLTPEAPIAVIVPCPSCARPMGFMNDSWQCLACHPIPTDVPSCATVKCRKPLTKLGPPWNCWICLKCNDHPEVVNKRVKEEEQRKRTYIDKTVSYEAFEKLQKQMAELLAKPSYPPTQVEIKTMTDPEKINAKPETVMQKAKRLGIRTHNEGTGGRRTTADIMADIEAVEKVDSEESIEEANEFREAAQEEPGEDTEYARGLKPEDMV